MKELLGFGVLAWPLVLLVLIMLGFIIAILFGVGYAARTGKSALCWGLLGFLLVYLLIFWDWIPTVVAHKYYCSTEAGFWVYKTPEQWKKENLGVMETLVANKTPVLVSHQDDGGNNWSYTEKWNQRINYISITTNYGPFFSNIRRSTTEIIDAKNTTVLGRCVDFSSSGKKRRIDLGWRFWLEADHCENNLKNITPIREYEKQFRGAEK